VHLPACRRRWKSDESFRRKRNGTERKIFIQTAARASKRERDGKWPYWKRTDVILDAPTFLLFFILYLQTVSFSLFRYVFIKNTLSEVWHIYNACTRFNEKCRVGDIWKRTGGWSTGTLQFRDMSRAVTRRVVSRSSSRNTISKITLRTPFAGRETCERFRALFLRVQVSPDSWEAERKSAAGAERSTED